VAESVTVEIPLFPLGTVLFPGGPLQLKIFEPRYLDMISRCLRERSRFGVVAIKEGSEVGSATTFGSGTTAEIVDWRQGADGLLGITVVGRDCFALEQTSRAADGLYCGRVRLRAQMVATPLHPEFAPLADLLRKLVPLGAQYRGMATAYDDAEWVSYRLAEILPLPLPAKQTLLELTDASARLRHLRESLNESGTAG
jgi:Lon protease-like protein